MLRLTVVSLVLALSVPLGRAEEARIESRVHAWAQAPLESTAEGAVRRICHGAAHDLAALEISGVTLKAGCVFAGDSRDDHERLVVVKEGRLEAEVGSVRRRLGPGSVVLVMPGDACRLAAPAEEAVTFYQFRYRSRQAVDPERGRRTGGSRLIEWGELPYTPTDVGGRRQPFERATAMFSEAEMHVTTLNPGLTTHPPHTHVPEEIVLMIRGETEMSIAGVAQRGGPGDLFFLGSEVPHNIHNVGTEPAEYFAFQWR